MDAVNNQTHKATDGCLELVMGLHQLLENV
jgi:hypothetical protein